ncbi:MAG: TonB-dependent siderophore receptor [Rubrivivax sp.]|nr:TonB-dependent siderophore receptor [Rubrivivax sp.]
MAPRHLVFTLTALASAASAQTSPPTTERVVITARSLPGVSGFGSTPLALSPLQASVIGAAELADSGIGSLAGIATLDAGISDAYNTEGYWSYLTVRGFVLDNRSNYRRDGLPISAETAIGLANKERVEVLKGTSGVQAGVSAPGGLVNLVVKRPTGSVRSARLDARQGGTLAASVDLSERFGEGQRFGLRVNAHAADLQPQVRHSNGSRRLLAVAGDWQLSPDTLLEAEFESSRQRQPSVPGFSLRGDVLPDADRIDPRTNLNNQVWSQPSVFDGETASLRLRQRVSADWQFTAHGATQRLRSDDRIAFPFGCYDAAAGTYYADRYCPDGSFDLYDFRSENERRRTDALDLQFAGLLRTGGLSHDVRAGVMFSQRQDRFQRQAYNYTGSGRDDGSEQTPAAPDLTDENTNRDERSTEFYLRDTLQLNAAWSLWGGLRHTRLNRQSERTDGSRVIDYPQSFTTPWLGLAWRASPATMLYTSWGQGIETDAVPNRSRYEDPGAPLPALKSRQFEAGVKHSDNGLEAGVTAFVITRPLAVDIGTCDADNTCVRRIDGSVPHQGLEAQLSQRHGAWTWGGSAMWLHARRQGASDGSQNGLRPTNVPRYAVKARIGHDLAALPGLRLQAALVHEGEREVLPDNSLQSPGWTRLDLAARWQHKAGTHDLVWQLALDNASDSRAWRETPYQFSHVYLFPLAPRTWRASVQASF